MELTPILGMMPYGSGAIGQNTQTATGLSAGFYYVVVTDDETCGATSATIEVTQPNAIDISFVTY